VVGCARYSDDRLIDSRLESSGMNWLEERRDGVQLWCADFGGSGPCVVLLHGLAGYAKEWANTAAWLSQSYRVVALEQRGHGRSERVPADVSRAAFVGDVEMWVRALDLAPVVLIGQSLGGHTAFLTAGKRPDVVRGLVVAEATPQADPEAPDVVRRWLDAWPVPFASSVEARSYFGGDTPWARVWAGGLEEREGGLWPAFQTDVMVQALEDSSRNSYWEEWQRVQCPTLIVRAANADGRGVYERMASSGPNTRLVEVENAGHDVHLDQPSAWRAALDGYLSQLSAS
jgi:pimeloyl-ACP methyl ester carboxylesterase